MARGEQAKLRRRNNRKASKEDPSMAFEDGEDEVDEQPVEMFPSSSKKEGDDDELEQKKRLMMKRKKQGVKTTPLVLLILLTGSALLPALLFASDYVGALLSKHHAMGQLGYRLGIGSVPRKRVLSFYEKHAPEKLDDVPSILAKHYGDYPRLVKRLERKYQDYGYFLGWEEDEAPVRLAVDQVQETLQDVYRIWLDRYWNVHAPQVLKTAARNIRYNVTFLVKKVRKLWTRQIWPTLQPYLGVPDEKTARRQKRADAEEARKRRAATSGQRQKNKDFRDDEDEN